MTTRPITISSDAGTVDAIKVMSQRNINRLIVSEDNKTIYGILSRADLLNIYD